MSIPSGESRGVPAVFVATSWKKSEPKHTSKARYP